MEVSLRIPWLTVNFCRCFAFDTDVTSPFNRVGHISIQMMEVSFFSFFWISKRVQIIARMDDVETDVHFLLRRMEIVLDNIPGTNVESTPLKLPFTILKPVPSALVPTFMTRRKTLLRTFQEWRKVVKDKNKSKTTTFQEEGLFNQLQISGRILFSKNAASVSLMTSFLVFAMDNQVVDACMTYYQEILKCKEQLDHDVNEFINEIKLPERTQSSPLGRILERTETRERQRFILEGELRVKSCIHSFRRRFWIGMCSFGLQCQWNKTEHHFIDKRSREI